MNSTYAYDCVLVPAPHTRFTRLRLHSYCKAQDSSSHYESPQYYGYNNIMMMAVLIGMGSAIFSSGRSRMELINILSDAPIVAITLLTPSHPPPSSHLPDYQCQVIREALRGSFDPEWGNIGRNLIDLPLLNVQFASSGFTPSRVHAKLRRGSSSRAPKRVAFYGYQVHNARRGIHTPSVEYMVPLAEIAATRRDF